MLDFQSGERGYTECAPPLLVRDDPENRGKPEAIRFAMRTALADPRAFDAVVVVDADNVVSQKAHKDKRTLAAFGVTPTPMDAILPSYLWRFRRNGQFERQAA